MTCLHCNGWGRVLRVNAPSERFPMEYRKKVFSRLTKTNHIPELPLVEQVCATCAGQGTLPEPRR